MGGVRRQLIRASRSVLLALAVLAPRPSQAEVLFSASAEAAPGADGGVVALRLRNLGSLAARAVFLQAELAGRRAELPLADLAPGGVAPLTLRFPGPPARPGRHALELQVEYTPEAPKDASPRRQPLLLLLDLGVPPPPALRVRIEPPAELDVAAPAFVVLESADGTPHRAWLRVLLATGVNALEAPAEVDVPAAGPLRVPLRLLRGDAPRGGRHAITAVAAPFGGALERAAAGAAEIAIAPDRAWLPRLRPALASLGAALLLAALYGELRARARRP